MREEDLATIKYGEEHWVQTDEDKKVWDNLSDEDKLLLSYEIDMGTWYDYIQGNADLEKKVAELESKFSRSKPIPEYPQPEYPAKGEWEWDGNIYAWYDTGAGLYDFDIERYAEIDFDPDEIDFHKDILEKKENTKEPTLTDFINSGDFHTILTDDARTFDVHEWEKRVEADDDSNSENLDEAATSTQKFVVSKEDVQEVLNKIANSDLFVANYYKTRGFMKSKGLTIDDIKELARQLSIDDYSYSMESSSFNPGDIISVFITNKDFVVNGINLSGLTLYIEIDVDYGDPVAIISVHDEQKGNKGRREKPYKESLKESKESDLADKLYNIYKYHSKGTTKRVEYDIDDIVELIKSNKIRYAIDKLDNLVNFNNKSMSNTLYNQLSDFLDELYTYSSIVYQGKSGTIEEDTVKTKSGKWVNKGDTGETHGEFKTKKAADAQRRAMFSRGYKAEGIEEGKGTQPVLDKINKPLLKKLDEMAQDAYDSDYAQKKFDELYGWQLAALWSLCIYSKENPDGQLYDDEVYDAIANRKDSDRLFELSHKIFEKFFTPLGKDKSLEEATPKDKNSKFDILTNELKTKAPELYKKGKRIYNKYAQSKINEAVDDKVEKETIRTPRGTFELYKGTYRDFKAEDDFEDWGFWFDYYYPDDAAWKDTEKWYKVFHNHKNNHAIAILFRDKTKNLKETAELPKGEKLTKENRDLVKEGTILKDRSGRIFKVVGIQDAFNRYGGQGKAITVDAPYGRIYSQPLSSYYGFFIVEDEQ